MPGWNGAGVFVLPYSFVAEAAAGVKILASHQDTQWNAIKGGLELCLTRDGQTAPLGDISWNNNKITSLATPTDDDDAATKAYVDSTFGEWAAELASVTWVSTTQFRVNGVDRTARYHAGRRVKVIHNTGLTTTYGTVISSTFGTDTVVTVVMDSNVSLQSTVTNVYYGTQSYTHDSYLDPRTALMAYVQTGYSTASSPETILFNTASVDSNAEYSTLSGLWTCRYPGNYQIAGQLMAMGPSNVSIIMQYGFVKNSITRLSFSQVVYAPSSEGTNPLPLPIPAIVATLTKGDTIEMQMYNGILNMTISGAISGALSYMSIVRIV